MSSIPTKAHKRVKNTKDAANPFADSYQFGDVKMCGCKHKHGRHADHRHDRDKLDEKDHRNGKRRHGHGDADDHSCH